MDPKKYFACPAMKHILNDSQRPWGAQSICPYCLQEKLEEDLMKAKRKDGQ